MARRFIKSYTVDELKNDMAFRSLGIVEIKDRLADSVRVFSTNEDGEVLKEYNRYSLMVSSEQFSCPKEYEDIIFMPYDYLDNSSIYSYVVTGELKEKAKDNDREVLEILNDWYELINAHDDAVKEDIIFTLETMMKFFKDC